MACQCFIIPADVLDKFSKDNSLSAAERQSFADAAMLDRQFRIARTAQSRITSLASSVSIAANLAASPTIPVYDCKGTQSLPGTPVPNPGGSTDATVKRTFDETDGMAKFLSKEFGRNSLDGQGMTLLSSVHFGQNFNNAFWNGTQMTYGDGDGNIFLDFTLSNDVIAHELTHGITQYTTGLAYSNQAGGLNESCSDIFGSMFRQWRKGQTVNQADWLIGKEIMGPAAQARGFTCLRDMADPAAKHCLAPQPKHFKNYKNGMDPHESSGIPNFVFYKAALAIGGKSWEKTGKIWYSAMANYAPSANMQMKTFAKRTRQQAKLLYASDPNIAKAIDAAWKAVGL